MEIHISEDELEQRRLDQQRRREPVALINTVCSCGINGALATVKYGQQR
jgi:hypothetical protein